MKILKEETYLVHAPYIHGEIFTVLCQHAFSDCSQPHLESNLLTTTSISTEAQFKKRRILIMSYPTGNETGDIKSGVLDAHTTQRIFKKKIKVYLRGDNPQISRHTRINSIYFSWSCICWKKWAYKKLCKPESPPSETPSTSQNLYRTEKAIVPEGDPFMANHPLTIASTYWGP
jgi:hypothetical protein